MGRSPPFDFLAQTFVPLLRRMGAQIHVELVRPGFYPAGGGRFEAWIEGGAPLRALELHERGEVQDVSLHACIAQIPEHVAERELKVLASRLAELPLRASTQSVQSAGPGNVASVTVRSQHVTETFTAFGERGVRAETVAHQLANEVRAYLGAGVPVGEHLADQLLLPLALAGGGSFRSGTPSLHATTNAEVIARFLPVEVAFNPSETAGHEVRVSAVSPAR